MVENIDLKNLCEELLRILPSGSLQDVMNISYKYVKVPVLVVDILYNVLGIAPEVKTGDYYWDYLLEHRGYETEMITQLYEEGIMQSVNVKKAPFIVNWGSCKERPKIQGVIKVNHIIEGYVTMNCTYEELTPDRMEAMEIIQNACTVLYSGKDSENSMKYTYQKSFAAELFGGRIHSQRQLDNWKNTVGISLEPSYLVAAITLSDEREKNTLSFIRKTLATLSPCQLALIRQNILYILYYQYDRYSSLENTWKYFKETLVKFNAHCGVSNLFDNLLEISIYQKQAEDAVILGRPLAPKHHIHYYSDYYLPAILTPALKSLPRASFVSPVIPSLQEYDQKNSTSLLTTLETYLEQFCHTANTIKELHIHRNTLLYRLKKIEEICDVSLQDYETLLHLMVSFYLLRIT
ncbi:MAG TPA: helix-turn-helix domain-containing protein [Candidatus Mediterraneibacter vanvlietii]|nr:helix-turn-helix domain-containing protein [Candidatus Mediterraneibacter vanvlietii]